MVLDISESTVASLTTVVCRTVVMHQAGIGGGLEVFVAGEQ